MCMEGVADRFQIHPIQCLQPLPPGAHSGSPADLDAEQQLLSLLQRDAHAHQCDAAFGPAVDPPDVQHHTAKLAIDALTQCTQAPSQVSGSTDASAWRQRCSDSEGQYVRFAEAVLELAASALHCNADPAAMQLIDTVISNLAESPHDYPLSPDALVNLWMLKPKSFSAALQKCVCNDGGEGGSNFRLLASKLENDGLWQTIRRACKVCPALVFWAKQDLESVFEMQSGATTKIDLLQLLQG